MPRESTAIAESLDTLRRREQILDAAHSLADEGGYEAVQMRAVADRGQVALGTLYRYYPSKIHLLVATFGREFAAVAQDLTDHPAASQHSDGRVVEVLERIALRLRRDRNLAEAMTRAIIFSDETSAEAVSAVEEQIDTMLVRALLADPHVALADVDADVAVTARLIRDVWLGAMVGWSGGRHSSSETQTYMAQVVRRVLG